MFEEKWECGLRCWSVPGQLSLTSYQQLLRTASLSSDSREASGRPGWGLGRVAWGALACVPASTGSLLGGLVFATVPGAHSWYPWAQVRARGCLVLLCPCSVPVSRSSCPGHAVWARDRPQAAAVAGSMAPPRIQGPA